MRRRAIRRVRRVKRKTEWLLSANLDCATLLRTQACTTETSDPNTFLMVFAPSTAAIAGSSGETNEVTVARLVGEWHFGATLTLPNGAIQGRIMNLEVAEGMYIADMPVTSGTTILDPSDAGDLISKDWMWLRTSIWQANYSLSGIASFNVPFFPVSRNWDPHYDVRVKRKMRANEGIVYSVAVYADASATVDPPGGGPVSATDVSAYVYGQGRALVLMP